jgi:hypothetical protein
MATLLKTALRSPRFRQKRSEQERGRARGSPGRDVAQFIDANGQVVVTLPATVQPAATSRAKVKVTALWGKNGPEVDIEITFGDAAAAGRSGSIAIAARPTR